MKPKNAIGKKLLFGFLLLCILSCLIAFASYLYLQSNYFKNRIASQLADITGDQVEIDEKLEIAQMLPALRLVLPVVKVQSINPESWFERLRIDGLSFEIPIGKIGSGIQQGPVNLQIEKLAAVARASKAKPLSDSKLNEKSLTLVIDEFRRQFSDLDLTAYIDHIDYITRDGDSIHYQLDEVKLKLSAEGIMAAGLYPQDGEDVDEFIFQILDIDDTGPMTKDLLTASLKGTIAPFKDFSGIDKTPIDISSSIEFKGNNLALTDIDFEGPNVWLRGDLHVESAVNTTTVEADIELRKLEIASLFPSNEKAATGGNFFSDEPLNLKLLDKLNLDIQLYLGAVRFNNEPVINGQLEFKAANGKVQIVSSDLSVLSGKSDFSLSLTQLQKELSFRLKLASKAMQLDRIRIDKSNSPVLERGKSDLLIALQGTGTSTATIASSLNGYLTAAVSDAFLKRKYATLIDQGVVSWARDKFSFKSENDQSEPVMVKESRGLPVNCASLRLLVNDGRVAVTNGAIVELPHNTLVSSGYIDLHEEKIGFVVRTKSDSLFDWSAISILEYLQINGSLLNPGVGLDLGALAKKGVLSTASWLYGPLPSLVYSLAEAGLKGREKIRCVSEIN